MKTDGSSPPRPASPKPEPPARRKRAARELVLGDILDTRFRLTEVIYRGAISTVYKAEDTAEGNAWVALKIPEKEFEINAALFSRFRREEEIGAKLDHPNVLKFIAVQARKSRPYIVMEYLRGVTLQKVLSNRQPMPERDALELASRICDPLRYLHEQGVIHRDLKPENIMICDDGSLRIMDFGIALDSESRGRTLIGFAAGTPHYMAPERIRRKPGDRRTDIYGVGAILYEMLTATIAFADEDTAVILESRLTGDPEAPRKLNPAISAQAEEIVLRAMELDPNRRYPTALALKKDLEAPSRVILTGRHDSLEPSTPWKRGWRKARRVAIWSLVPILVQVLLFLLLWRHYAKK